MAGELAPLQSAIPIVANNSDRETRYPPASRIQNQRVQNLATGSIQRWTGSVWVDDFVGSSIESATFNVKSAPFNATGNGATDDTTAIAAAITAANTVHGVVLVPAGTYLVTGAGLSVPSGVDFVMQAGAILLYNGSGICITLYQCIGGKYDLSVQRTSVQWHDNATDVSSEGVRMTDCTFSQVTVRMAVGFWKAINFYGDGSLPREGCQGITLYLGYTDQSKIGIGFTAVSGGFANQNTIIGGNTILEASDLVGGNPVAGSKLVDLSTTGDGNLFVGVDFEGNVCEENITIISAMNHFVGCRWEQIRKVHCLTGSLGNRFDGGYGNPGIFDGITFFDDSLDNIITGGYPVGGSTLNGYGTPGSLSVPALTLRARTGNGTALVEGFDFGNGLSYRITGDGKLQGFPNPVTAYPIFQVDLRAGIVSTGTGTVAPTTLYNVSAGTNVVFNKPLVLNGTYWTSGQYVVPSGTTTPDVSTSNYIATVNATPTTITNFINGDGRQRISVVVADSNTTIANGSFIHTISGQNIPCVVDHAYEFINLGGLWVEIGRSIVAGTAAVIGVDPGGAQLLRVGGSAVVNGAVTVITGGLTVTAGGATVTAGGAAITGNSTIAGSLAVSTGFGANGATPQTPFASGGAAPAGGTGATAGAYDTSAHRDALITLVNNMRTALVNAGFMS